MAQTAIPYDFRPNTPEELERCLGDPWWRLFSGALYKIIIKSDGSGDDGLVAPFKPNRAQRKLLKRFHTRNLILKARQLGFTTLIAIFFLDCALFRENVRAGIICQDLASAEVIFRDKVRFAYNNLPESLRLAMPLAQENSKELLFAHNESSIRVSTSLRSGTVQYLHVSEMGKIGAKFPEKAKEIITGSIPALADDGLLFIESTSEGQEGEFYKLATEAMKLAQSGNPLSPKQLKFHFFPWWEEAKYRQDPDLVIITDDDNHYFDKIEGFIGREIDIEQRAWWVEQRDSAFSGDDSKMWQEYPSTPEEAFQKSTEGCYYTKEIVAARKQRRITTVPYMPGYPVNTYWDIGAGDGCAIWLHQQVGQTHRFIDFIEGWGEPYAYFVGELQARGYVWGFHYLPHDGAHVRQGMVSNLSPQEQLTKLGLRNVEIVPRVEEVQHGIMAVRNIMPACWFDEVKCKKGIAHLELYRKKWNTTTQNFTDIPLHDIHSEASDAFRGFAQSEKGHVMVRAGQRPKRKVSARAV